MGARIALLGGFGLTTDAGVVTLSKDAQRLVAFLALESRPPRREQVAGALWRECSQIRSDGNLRTAIWRTRLAAPGLVTVPMAHHLALESGAECDISTMTSHAQSILSDAASCTDDDLLLTPFIAELLPGWYDEWVVAERERIRQLRLHALEAISERLLARFRVTDALEAAMTAVALDPFRDTARRCVIRVHLTEGNRAEALRYFESDRDLLRQELGIAPSDHLAALVG